MPEPPKIVAEGINPWFFCDVKGDKTWGATGNGSCWAALSSLEAGRNPGKTELAPEPDDCKLKKNTQIVI